MKKQLACRMCVVRYGLVGWDLSNSLMSEDQLIAHIEKVHHIPVRRKGESRRQAQKRFLLENPEAGDIKTCRCEYCGIKRKGN